MAESKNVGLIETRSQVLSPPTNESDNIDEIDDIGIISFDDGRENCDMLRDEGDYTSRKGFINDVVDHTISTLQPRDLAIADILTRNPCGCAGRGKSNDSTGRRRQRATIATIAAGRLR